MIKLAIDMRDVDKDLELSDQLTSTFSVSVPHNTPSLIRLAGLIRLQLMHLSEECQPRSSEGKEDFEKADAVTEYTNHMDAAIMGYTQVLLDRSVGAIPDDCLIDGKANFVTQYDADLECTYLCQADEEGNPLRHTDD